MTSSPAVAAPLPGDGTSPSSPPLALVGAPRGVVTASRSVGVASRSVVTASRSVGAASPQRRRSAQVEIVVPVLDEERVLAASVRRLHRHLQDAPYTWRVTVADNASTDGTLAVARGLARELPGVEVVHLPQKGRGRALHAVWSASDAQVLAYMDVDLSTDLDALLPLVAPLLSGHSDLVIGSRLARSARVARGPKREVICRGYNLLLHGTLHVRFSDAQCGFKAIRADRARGAAAARAGHRLVLRHRAARARRADRPADRRGPGRLGRRPRLPGRLVATARADLRGIARLARGLADGEHPGRRPCVASCAPSEPADVADRAGRPLRGGRGREHAGLPRALPVLRGRRRRRRRANAASLLITAMLNTAVNRR